MNPDSVSSNSAAASTSYDGWIKILFLYEDGETRERGKRSLGLLEGLGLEKSAIYTRVWRRDLLNSEPLREQAAVEAAASHVILVSVHGGEFLPQEISDWLERWRMRKHERPYAIGLLLDERPAGLMDDHPVLSQFRALAASTGADLFHRLCAKSLDHIETDQEVLQTAMG